MTLPELKSEQVFCWEDLTEDVQQTVAIVHAEPLGVKPEKILRLFKLGHPKIVIGPEFKYLRIHAESVDVMKIILRQYL
jgi:hypothetical protein